MRPPPSPSLFPFARNRSYCAHTEVRRRGTEEGDFGFSPTCAIRISVATLPCRVGKQNLPRDRSPSVLSICFLRETCRTHKHRSSLHPPALPSHRVALPPPSPPPPTTVLCDPLLSCAGPGGKQRTLVRPFFSPACSLTRSLLANVRTVCNSAQADTQADINQPPPPPREASAYGESKGRSSTMLRGYGGLGSRLLYRPCGVATAAIAHPAASGAASQFIMSSMACMYVRTFSTATPLCLARRLAGTHRRQRNREPTKGDWLCQCGEVNYQSKRECYKCGAPAPPLPPGVRRPSLPGEDPHDWACPCGQMNFRGAVVCHKCQQPKPVPPPLPGKEITMWTCPKCKSINRSNRKFCFKCSVPSPLVEFKPQQ
ncbi:hypothetical protein, conserved [Leishmania tarentolae]|uniref:RanBP2-type domain-containing protein n=1 Tax=Leishmania tarentolae TaxID=5689 RepID=A0A640KBA7_LEITA|nr:hypothetical protein, conserved [Leishmania tarentolae]